MVGVEVLLGNEPWVRRLAGALVRDDDEAEDVVQETRLAAWRRPPRDPARPRAWLGVVVRNVVRNRRRAQGRLARLNSEAAPESDAVPSAGELLERLDLHRELAVAVSGLSEPFRQVVLLRYYEGLSSAEIARRLGVPAGTVRWRLKTALDRLRAGLDSDHDGVRALWIAALAPLARQDGEERASAGAPQPRSSLADRRPGLASPVTGTALILALAATALWIARARSGTPPGSPEAAGRLEAGSLLNAPPASSRPPTPPRPRAAAAVWLESGLPAWTQVEDAPHRPIAGKVVSNGRAVAGARLRLSNGLLSSNRNLDRHTVSDANGLFAFPPQPPTSWFLTVSADGLEPAIVYLDLREASPRSIPGGQSMDALIADLRPCRAFAQGVVRDTGGGVVAAARVRLAASWDNGGIQARSDGAGRYKICLPRAVPSYPLTLIAEASGYGTVETRAPAEAQILDFALEEQGTIAGRTVRDLDGQPLADVNVALIPRPPSDLTHPPAARTQAVRLVTTTDELGRFEITGVAAGQYTTRFRHDEAMRTRADVITIKSGEHVRDLEVRLSPVSIVEGVTSRQGKPAANVKLTFRSRDAGLAPFEEFWTRSTGEGRFRVRLVRGAELEILAPDPARPGGPWFPVLSPASFRVGEGRPGPLVVELGTASDQSDFVTPAGVAAAPPQHDREARFGDQIRLLGYDLESDHVTRGDHLGVTLHFQVLAPLDGWRPFFHLEGPGGFRNLDHGPVEGRYPASRWRPGETIRDRFFIRIDGKLSAGTYTLLTGFWKQTGTDSQRLTVIPAEDQDGQDRLRVLTFTVD
jgi:RNA polymerase sigma-70 factor (ECF subfamily)